MSSNAMYHEPVMLTEAVEGLAVKPSGTYVDATFGGGGHSKAILGKLGPEGRLYAFDRDPDAVQNTIDDERFTLVEADFKFLKNYLKLYRALPIDGLLADLGVSSHQFDAADRGFSTRHDADLDMRMDKSAPLTAATIVNEYDEAELARLFKNYGELKKARLIAREIVRSRSEHEIRTTDQLKAVLEKFAPRGKEAKFHAQVFQALRIEVNDELGALHELILQAEDALKEGGRMVIIAYHSLEDRPVKHFFKTGNFEGKQEKDFYGNIIRPMTPLVNKVIVPGEEEIKKNPRARSAKMRIAIKNG